jgi:branched-chain amino acid transport system ATP-binding protein
MAGMLLETSDLRTGYGAGDVLQGATFAVARGEIVAIIGRNGVGKTTLMKAVIGLLPTRSGSIRLHGREISVLPAEDRARCGLGYVPQGKQIFRDLTVEENLKLGERVNTAEQSNYRLVYELFPWLQERSKQKGGTLSGGEQQALAISRALVGRPELLLLDEPSESIQPSRIAEIGDSVKRLNLEFGLTVVCVEQNVGLIQKISHRGYVLDKGRIVASLTKDEISDREQMVKHLSI